MSYNKETGMYEGFIYKIYNDVNDKVYIGQTISTVSDRWSEHKSAARPNSGINSYIYKAMRKYGIDKFHIEEVEKFEDTEIDSLFKKLNIAEIEYISKYKSLSTENGYNLQKGGDNFAYPGRWVCKYDFGLNLIAIYESVMEAARLNDLGHSVIQGVCQNKTHTAGGYLWFFKGEEPFLPPFIQKMKDKSFEIYKKILSIDDRERQYWLFYLQWDGRKIVQYNSFEEIINVFDDIYVASKELNIPPAYVRSHLEGKKLCFGKTVLRYEDEPFNKYPRSRYLQPVSIYDLQGNHIQDFETKKDAENFLGASSGNVNGAIKNGMSIKGYLISEYGKPLQRKTYRTSVSVLMCDNNFNVIKEFLTKLDATTFLGLSHCTYGLDTAIKNKTEYYGYYWMIKEEFSITG